MANKRACIIETDTSKNDHDHGNGPCQWTARAYLKTMQELANIERPVRGLIAEDGVNGFTKTDVPKKMIHKMKKVQVLNLK